MNPKNALTRREFIRLSAAAAAGLGLAATMRATPAPAAPPMQQPTVAPTVAPTKVPRIDFATAAKPYAGQTLNILCSAGPWGTAEAKSNDDFTKLTGIKINMENMPEGDAWNARRQSELLSGSTSLDILPLGFGEIVTYLPALTDVSTLMNNPALPEYDMSDYTDPVINFFMKRNGKFYGFPVCDGVQIMFYRQDLFDAAGLKPPKTWKEVYEAAKKLQTADVIGAAWDMKGAYTFARVKNLLVPGGFVDKDYRATIWRDPQSIENVSYWAQIYKEGLCPKDTLANDLVATYALFQQGKLAMQPLGWVTGAAQMEDPTVSKVAGKVGYAPIPGGAPNMGGWTDVIPVKSQHKEAAYIYIAWLTSRETEFKQVTQFGNFDLAVFHSTMYKDPAFTEAILKRPSGKSDLMMLTAANQGHPIARADPLDIPEWGKMADAVGPIIQQTVTGTFTPKDGMNKAADAIEKILDDAGYYKKK
jgi:multiple sugar transport system substrate-binding protein